MKKLYLIPLGEIPSDVLDSLKASLENLFGFSCRIGDLLEIPPEAYNPGRDQYLAPALLGALATRFPIGALGVLGVTDVDMYAPNLNFIFGQAELNGELAIISLCRLRQDFYGFKPSSSLLGLRALKEAVHELGHMFGLDHCERSKCVMRFSNNLRETDGKSSTFCEDCRIRLTVFLSK